MIPLIKSIQICTFPFASGIIVGTRFSLVMPVVISGNKAPVHAGFFQNLLQSFNRCQ